MFLRNTSLSCLLISGSSFTDHFSAREQEEQQDKKDQELHEAAISGRLRLKRNRGVGIDDSDEESDDDDNERARRAMKKLRSSDRGDIKDLGLSWNMTF